MLKDKCALTDLVGAVLALPSVEEKQANESLIVRETSFDVLKAKDDSI